jgi:hypothetical protein
VPPRRRGALISLVPLEPLPDSVRMAQIEELTPWVDRFRKAHAEYWPEPGTGAQGPAVSYRRRYPWPHCWKEHPSLVTNLRCLRRWTVAIESGDLETADAYGGDYDRWIRHVEEVTAPLVQDIGRVCMAGGVGFHIDPASPRRRADNPRQATSAPRYPHSVYRRSAAMPPFRLGWP